MSGPECNMPPNTVSCPVRVPRILPSGLHSRLDYETQKVKFDGVLQERVPALFLMVRMLAL